jgi:hypothetical protein
MATFAGAPTLDPRRERNRSRNADDLLTSAVPIFKETRMNSKRSLVSLFALIALAATAAWAQAPAGSTGQCKDNSYTSADSKRGACRGHGGVKDWYATDKAAPPVSKDATVPPAKSAATESPASKAGAKTTTKAAADRSEPAVGGGAGKVWVNTATNVYHCNGTRWYGKTKQGEYMSEEEAKAKHAHADHGKSCG